jgi:ribonuclease T
MPDAPPTEVLVSVDIEASGPSPSTGSLLAIGACLVDDPAEGFYVEVRPDPGARWDESAEGIHGLTREHLAGAAEPRAAMQAFADWLERVAVGRTPVFVAFNATFDWMFVADAFHRYLGRNPFGISGLDQKAYFMGKHGVARWSDTAKLAVRRRYPTGLPHSHHALEDAREQAELMRDLLAPAVEASTP